VRNKETGLARRRLGNEQLRVLLVHPPIERAIRHKREACFPSIGLGYLAGALRSRGHLVTCVDAYVKAAMRESGQARSFESIVAEAIQTQCPSIVGITTVSHMRRRCFDVARLAKRVCPGIQVVLGGPYASLQYEQILNHFAPLVDYVVRGEGEEVFPALIESIERGSPWPDIRGVSFQQDGRVKTTPPAPRIEALDELAYPYYGGHTRMLSDGHIPTIGMIANRGCPFSCHFCGSSAFWQQEVRMRSPKNVVDEIEHFQGKHGTEKFKFHDDTFTLSRPHALEIFREVIRRGLKTKLYIHTRVEKIDSEVVETFKEAGGRSIYFGLESGSPRLRSEMGKPEADLDSFVEDARTTKRLGLSIGVFVLLGYPGETPEDVYETYRLLQRIQPDDVYVSSTKIQPGTALSKRAKRMGIHRDEDWLDENQQYFTFVQSEQKDFVQGCILLFDEMYRREPLRTAFENNNEANDLRESGVDCARLKQCALEKLDIVARTRGEQVLEGPKVGVPRERALASG